jgi:hypothetical protein
VWAPRPINLGVELFKIVEEQDRRLTMELEGGKWRGITEVTAQFDDRSAPVKKENRVGKWVGGIGFAILAVLMGCFVSPWMNSQLRRMLRMLR